MRPQRRRRRRGVGWRPGPEGPNGGRDSIGGLEWPKTAFEGRNRELCGRVRCGAYEGLERKEPPTIAEGPRFTASRRAASLGGRTFWGGEPVHQLVAESREAPEDEAGPDLESHSGDLDL